jgi:hypothetical protein
MDAVAVEAADEAAVEAADDGAEVVDTEDSGDAAYSYSNSYSYSY